MSRQVIVIGAGQGGLSAAIHARLLGWNVLLLEQSDRVGGKAAAIQLGDYRLDPGPSIVIMPHIYSAVFSAANRRMADYLEFLPLDTISRTYFDRTEPYDLSSGIDRATDWIAQIDADDAKSFRAFMERFAGVADMVDSTIFRQPIESWVGFLKPKFLRLGKAMGMRGSYRLTIDTWFKSPLLKSFFYGFPSYSGQTYESTSAGGLWIPYYMISGGVFYPKGGVSSIPYAFERLAREVGVEIRRNMPVIGFDMKGDRITAVLTPNERIEADAVIANVDPESFASIFGRPIAKRPSYSYFTMHWGVPHLLPGVSHHTLLVPPDFERSFSELYHGRYFPKEPIVYLNNTTVTDPATSPPGKTNLFAVVTCPADEPHLDWTNRTSMYADRVRRSLDRFGIDIGEPEFERIQTPKYFAARHGNGRGSLYGPDEQERFMRGILPIPNGDPVYKNLVYCGGAVQPGAGLPMVTLSGKFAAERIHRKLG